MDNARQLLQTLFFEPKRYDLGNVGRYKLNKKLALKRRIVGTQTIDRVVDPATGEVLAEAGTNIDKRMAERLDQAGVIRLSVRLRDGSVVRVVSNGQPPADQKTISRQDIVASINYLITLFKGLGTVDDIDHLGNRRLRSVGELLQNTGRSWRWGARVSRLADARR